MKTATRIGRRGALPTIAAALALVALTGVLDVVTGTELKLGVLYAVPVALVAWRRSFSAAVVVAAAGAVTGTAADWYGGKVFSHLYLRLWGGAMDLAVLLVLAWAFHALSEAARREGRLARTDALTDVANRRGFLEALRSEAGRSLRYGHPFTVLYMDVDGFKNANDRLGHSEGDALLRLVGRVLGREVRSTDTVARLGGDEFGILLPETDASSAGAVAGKIHASLTAAAREADFPVTFSVGALTCRRGDVTVDEIMRAVDALLYQAKAEGKNTIRGGDLDPPGLAATTTHP